MTDGLVRAGNQISGQHGPFGSCYPFDHATPHAFGGVEKIEVESFIEFLKTRMDFKQRNFSRDDVARIYVFDINESLYAGDRDVLNRKDQFRAESAGDRRALSAFRRNKERQ